MLLVEVIVASFLMLFAFAAASSLFDASLRWESESGNLRRAAMLADKTMEDLRFKAGQVPSGQSFSDILPGLLGTSSDSSAPGFVIETSLFTNTHRTVQTSGLTPPPGVHSPCSSMYTAVPPVNPPDNNPQLNNQYGTYPYTRYLPASLPMVQVAVTYAEGRKTYRLVSLIGDPVTPFAATPTVQVTKVSGPSSLNNFTTSAVYTAQVVTSTGSLPKDVTIIWGVTLGSTGSLVFLPSDSSGRNVSVKRRTSTPLGANAQARVQALVRYGGKEAVGVSDPISLP